LTFSDSVIFPEVAFFKILVTDIYTNIMHIYLCCLTYDMHPVQ